MSHVCTAPVEQRMFGRQALCVRAAEAATVDLVPIPRSGEWVSESAQLLIKTSRLAIGLSYV